jgi:hypothetical protein
MIALTTFSPSGYELYGEKLLYSLIKHWPGEVIAYVDEIPPLEHPKIGYRYLNGVFGYETFKSYCSKNPMFSGKIMGGYSYTYDAVRFCHKAFAQFDCLGKASLTQTPVFWIDGDSELLKPVTEGFMTSLFKDAALAILSRPGFYTETGFVGFNTAHPAFKNFLDTYMNIYRRGMLFTLPGWHDCYALDAAINMTQTPYHDLVGGWKMQDELDVLPKTILGEYLVHLKGGKKFRNSGNGSREFQRPIPASNS